MRRKLALALVGLALTLTLNGCARRLPPITEAEGVVLLGGSPLPNVLVTFVPQLSEFGAEANSFAVTDDKGHFTLQCAYKGGQAGAVVGKHKVTIVEAPLSAEFRGQDAAQERYAAYLKKLKNRPIPPQYGSIAKTPLEVEVTADQKTYQVILTR